MVPFAKECDVGKTGLVSSADSLCFPFRQNGGLDRLGQRHAGRRWLLLLAVRILKSVALSQSLQINGNVECLRRLVRRWCTSTHSFIPYIHVAFLIAWLSKFIFGGFSKHEIMVECIPIAICLAKGVKLSLAPVMLGTLYHMLDLLHTDEILGAGYYIIETHTCLSLLQMFTWERFCPYHLGCVTNGKALKEYLMIKCGYTSGTTLLACSWIRKRKVKGQVVPEINNFLDDYGSFNFHAYKAIPGHLHHQRRFETFRDVGGDNTIYTAMYQMARDLELGAWRATIQRELHDSLAMIRTSLLLLFQINQIGIGPCSLILRKLLQPCGLRRGQWGVGACMPPNSEHGAGRTKPRRKCWRRAIAGASWQCEASQATLSKKPVLGKTKSIAYPSRGGAHRAFALPTSRQSKAKASMPSKSKASKERETSNANDNEESSWSNSDSKTIERTKKPKPISGNKHPHERRSNSSSLLPRDEFV
ncbi:hypothetical protein SLEP1_g36017 [Rubroshorea leprosula]|uniref:Aminotransferase-like plant mobile domain-containing protein n=1 Tax=Rubroshorea leprosula TaxID=152421 RepID=A0AAV5KQL7_9ROSI|nr:hypothetical protein SLEP1_g36017 [Rubroshorea leprosula]